MCAGGGGGRKKNNNKPAEIIYTPIDDKLQLKVSKQAADKHSGFGAYQQTKKKKPKIITNNVNQKISQSQRQCKAEDEGGSRNVKNTKLDVINYVCMYVCMSLQDKQMQSTKCIRYQ